MWQRILHLCFSVILAHLFLFLLYLSVFNYQDDTGLIQKKRVLEFFFFFPINVKVDGLRHIIWEGILDLNLGRLPQECLFLLLTWSMQRT